MWRRPPATRPSASSSTAGAPAFALDEQPCSRTSTIARRRSAAMRTRATCGVPATSALDLSTETSATLVASTESWDLIEALNPEDAAAAESERREHLLAGAEPAARFGIGAELVLAADQFVIRPSGRREDAARARAAGGDVRTVIAGYHWFTDWGRDTMISLDGLTLRHRPPRRGRLHPAHVRPVRARRAHPQHVSRRRATRACITPPTPRSGSSTPSTAISQTTGDSATLAALLPKLADIVALPSRGHALRHRRRPEGRPAHARARTAISSPGWTPRCGGWVVTPRRGKAVEINALWYNALPAARGLDARVGRRGGGARPRRPTPTRAGDRSTSASGMPSGGYLYDVVDELDGRQDDSACRPNQLLAISLTHPVLDRVALGARWSRRARAKLLTPVGLRSLSPDHPDYKPTLSRRSPDARRRLPSGHGVGVAHRSLHRRVAQGAPGRPRGGRAAFSTASCRIWTRPASARSARSSTPTSPTRRGAASRRRGASRRSCAAGCGRLRPPP